MSHLLPTESVVDAYLQLRRRVIDLLRSLHPDQGSIVVPACPAWTIHDLAAHLVGVPEDILAGRMEGVTTEAWTQAQVDRHRDESLSRMADVLEALAPAFDAVLPHIPAPVNSQMVMDAVTHELDLRAAIGSTEARTSLAVDVAVGWLLESAKAKNFEPVPANVDSTRTAYDVLRSLTGRRTLEQIAASGLEPTTISRLLEGSPLHIPTHAVE